MKRHLALLMFVGLLVTMAPAPAWGCSCVAPDAEEMLASHDFAFVGSLVDKQPAGRGEFGGEALYTFQVSGWAKGNLGDTVAVLSADNGAACGFELAPGHEAAIFLSKIDGNLSGGLCSTMDAASLEAISDLAPPAPDTTPPPGETPPEMIAEDSSVSVGTLAAATAAVAAAAAAAFVWVRRRQRA